MPNSLQKLNFKVILSFLELINNVCKYSLWSNIDFNKFVINNINIYSRLSRCSTGRGSDSGLSLGDPTWVKARKSFLFTEGILKVERMNTCLILLSHYMCIRWLKSCFTEQWKIWESVYIYSLFIPILSLLT